MKNNINFYLKNYDCFLFMRNICGRKITSTNFKDFRYEFGFCQKTKLRKIDESCGSSLYDTGYYIEYTNGCMKFTIEVRM